MMAEQPEQAESAVVSVTPEGRIIPHIIRKTAISQAELAGKYAAQKARTTKPRTNFSVMAGGGDIIAQPASQTKPLQGNDIYALNYAKLHVPTNLNDASPKYAQFAQLDIGAKIFMQVARANIRFGSAVTMIASYSKGRTTRMLQLVTHNTAQWYLPWTRDPESYDNPAVQPPGFITLSADLSVDETLEMIRKTAADLSIVFPTLKDGDYVGTDINVYQGRGIPYLWNSGYTRLLPGGGPITFTHVIDEAGVQRRANHTPKYLNEPFFTQVGNKYKPNKKYLRVKDDKTQPFAMVRKGIGLLVSALQHIINATTLYRQAGSLVETDTFYRLPAVYKNAVRILSLAQTRLQGWVDLTNLPNNKTLKDVVKSYYYGDTSDYDARRYYLAIGFLVELLIDLNERGKLTSQTVKKRQARMMRENAEKTVIIETERTIRAQLGGVVQAGQYVGIPIERV